MKQCNHLEEARCENNIAYLQSNCSPREAILPLFFCLQIPIGSKSLILQQIPAVKLNHCNIYYSMALATRFSAGGPGQKGVVLFNMRLHGQPSKPAPTSMLHSQELGWSSSAVLTDPKVAANSPSMDGDSHSSLPDLEPAWACTSGFSLEHCCPAPPEESEASSHSELESVPGANVSTDIYLPLKCTGIFLNLFTTALPGYPLPQQLTASLSALMWVLEIL